MQCVLVDADGVVRLQNPQPSDITTCALVLAAPAEVIGVSAFSVPDSSQAATAWAAGFSLPMIVWLSAWALGTVIKFASSDGHSH